MSEPKDPYLTLLDRQIKRTVELTFDHLSCRQGALNHSWQPVEPDFSTNLRGARAMAMQCTRCFAIKRYVVSKRYGEYLSDPVIEYPEGYLLTRRSGEKGRVVSAQAVRAAFVKRLEDELPPMVVLEIPEAPATSEEAGATT